jgi:hypothetical protein
MASLYAQTVNTVGSLNPNASYSQCTFTGSSFGDDLKLHIQAHHLFSLVKTHIMTLVQQLTPYK